MGFLKKKAEKRRRVKVRTWSSNHHISSYPYWWGAFLCHNIFKEYQYYGWLLNFLTCTPLWTLDTTRMTIKPSLLSFLYQKGIVLQSLSPKALPGFLGLLILGPLCDLNIGNFITLSLLISRLEVPTLEISVFY